ncbi:MAG TPA: gliding motility-associated C-terminal domain-containing protein, partial [Puia sp.]|nr:gliding motility-associated C-terminal domain-containing protein [Puia sp.]
VTGTWFPATVNTSRIGSTTYTFTPDPGQCSTPVTQNITIVTSLTPTFPTLPESICQNATPPQLPAKSIEGVSGTWSPTTISTDNTGSTTYTFTPNAGQCGTSTQITVMVTPLPTLTMGPDVTIGLGGSTTLNVTVTGNIVTYQWNPATGLNNPSIKDPIASPTSTTLYTLKVTDDNQCDAMGSIKVTVSGGTTGKISVPNAFSPNGDGTNDTWVIGNISAFPGATVDVFNRYGQQVFHSENYSKAWDGTYNGKLLPMGTYYYIIDLKNNEKKIAGSITLFR